jgi:nicotinate (nicotinamide) nucleotide adenylyltransferase
MALIALLGGSYNPTTEAHLKSAQVAKEALGCDRMRLLFSENPLKDPNEYAPLLHRIRMAELRLSFHPEYDFELADEEDRLGTHITYEVLTALKRENPGDQFVWIMGDDNFIKFEHWHYQNELLEHFPIIVVPRECKPEELAKKREFEATYAHLRRNSVEEAVEKGGWFMLDVPIIPGSSTEFKADMKAGVQFSHPADQALSNYAHNERLYGLQPLSSAPAPAPDTKSGIQPS